MKTARCGVCKKKYKDVDNVEHISQVGFCIKCCEKDNGCIGKGFCKGIVKK